MKRVIFSLYINIPDKNLELDMGPFPEDNIERTVRVKTEYTKYFDQLIDNHKTYANGLGIDYKYFVRDRHYEEFYASLIERAPYLSEYNVINFYKFYLIEKLSKEYDEILYVDLDVAFNTEENFFNEWDLSKGIHLAARDLKEKAMRYIRNAREYNRRDPAIKYLLCMAMAMLEFKGFEHPIYNTGIIGINKEYVKKLNYTDKLPSYLKLITKTMHDNFFTEELCRSFDWNNEAIFSYIVFKDEIECIDTTGEWNYHIRRQNREQFDKDNKKMIHFILKYFDWYFGD